MIRRCVGKKRGAEKKGGTVGQGKVVVVRTDGRREDDFRCFWEGDGLMAWMALMA